MTFTLRGGDRIDLILPIYTSAELGINNNDSVNIRPQRAGVSPSQRGST